MPKITGTFVQADGSPATGVVEFAPSVAVGDGPTVLLPAPCSITLDHGSFAVTLPATDDPAYTPAGWVWQATERIRGGREPYHFTLTADTDYWDLTVAHPPDDYTVYALDVALDAEVAARTLADSTHASDTTAVHGIADTSALVVTSDPRLSDTRDPKAHSHAPGDVTGTAVVTGDSRLSDPRTPTAHAASHGTGQADAITIAPAQVTGTAVVNTIVDAKGDLIAASAADTPARLAVGVAGTNPILTPDTTAASGLAWKSHADANVAKASTVGNLLTSNQASVETDTAGFIGYTNVADLDVSTEHARHGTHSLKVTSTGSDDTRVQLSEGLYTYTVPLVPLLPHTFLFYVKSEATPRDTTATIVWRDSAGDATGFPVSITSAAVTSSTSDWTLVQVTGVAPATAATAQPVVTFAGSVAAEVHYIDCLSFHVGAGGEWALPGVPIPNLGIRANPADSTQVQIWNPGNSTWITV